MQQSRNIFKSKSSVFHNEIFGRHLELKKQRKLVKRKNF